MKAMSKQQLADHAGVTVKTLMTLSSVQSGTGCYGDESACQGSATPHRLFSL